MSLMFSRPTVDRALTIAELGKLAPAAFSETKADHLSGRYNQVTTATAIDVLADYGFRPVQAAQKASRVLGKTPHAAHLLAFAPERALAVDGTRGEVVLYNSHDGMSSLKLFAGAYRFICSNGIVAGEGFEASLRHTKATVANFETMLRDTVASIPTMLERIEKMQRETLTQAQAIDFAYNAATLRWELEAKAAPITEDEPRRGAFATDRTISQMLRARRYGDDGYSKWGVFNRVQESLMRGGVSIRSYTDNQPRGTERRARPVGSVDLSVQVNRRLWDAIEAVAA